MRLFVGYLLPELVRRQLASAWEQIPSRPSGTRAIAEANWHITVAFLGEVSEERVPILLTRIETWAKTLPLFEFQIIRLEAFPQKNPRYIAAHVERDALASIGAKIDQLRDLLSVYVSRVDRKPWMPHVAIAKTKSGGTIAGWKFPIDPPILWRARDLALIKSTLGPTGSTYEEIQSF